MKSILRLATVLFSIATLADTAIFTVEGMHCGGCKKMVNKSVCLDPQISKTLSACEITVDEKKQIGKVTLKSASQEKMNIPAIETAILKASSDFKIFKKELL